MSSPAMPSMFIRADASPGMGIGHVMRSMALAQAWMATEQAVTFISYCLDPALAAKLTAQGIQVFSVDRAWPDPTDLEQTLAILQNSIRGNPPPSPWVVIDGYHFSPDYQRAIRKAGYRTLVVDDTGHLGAYDADILVNQNLWASRVRYPVPPNTRVLAGSRYAMLRKEFSRDQDFSEKTFHRQNLNIMVTLGGSDPFCLTPFVIQALGLLNLPDLKVKVVLGPSCPHLEDVRTAARDTVPSMEVLTDPDMAPMMAWADLAITAGGSTCWELCRAGVPFIVFPVAGNQINIAESLEVSIGAVNAGTPGRRTVSEIAERIKGLIDDPTRRRQMSFLGQDLVDGRGAFRIVREIQAGNLTIKADGPDAYTFTADHGQGLAVRVQFCPGQNRVAVSCQIEPEFRNLGLTRALLTQSLMQRKQDGQLGNCWYQLSPDSGTEKPCPLKTVALISDPQTWMNSYIPELMAETLVMGHQVKWLHDVHDIGPCDAAFYLSCGQIVPPKILKQNRHNLVVHGSDLPRGRGWSPISWQILEGENQIPMTLFEASEKVDSGPIYLQEIMVFKGNELLGEIRKKTARTTIALCLKFLRKYEQVSRPPRLPVGEESRYPKRTPKDSELDPDQTIRSQFNLLRIVDNDRYPAFFSMNGTCYKLTITPMENHEDQ